MEEAAELSDYLPLSFTSPKEQEYVAFLWDAFETNYTHGKYQFAFPAYHMLTMSFIYFNIWKIKKTEPKNFEMSLIGFGKDVEKNLIAATSPFVFSMVNERTILRILKLIPELAFTMDRSESVFRMGPEYASAHNAAEKCFAVVTPYARNVLLVLPGVCRMCFQTHQSTALYPTPHKRTCPKLAWQTPPRSLRSTPSGRPQQFPGT